MKAKTKTSPAGKAKNQASESAQPATKAAEAAPPPLQVVEPPVIDPTAAIKQAYAAGNDPEALQLGNDYLAGHPDNKDILKIIARIHNRQKDWSAAYTAWAQLCELEPKSPEPPLQLARLALRNKDWPAALNHARHVLQIDASHEEALNSSLTCLLNQNDYLQAAAVAKQLLALKKTTSQPAMLKLAVTMFEKASLMADALELATQLSSTCPDNADASKLRARILANLQTDAIAAHLEDDTEAAAKACRDILRTLPQHERASAIMREIVRPTLLQARNHYKAQQMEAAVESYLAVLALDPGNIESLRSLARIHGKSKNDAAATGYWSQLITLTPEDPEPLLQLARIHVRSGNSEAAYLLYQKLAATTGPAGEEAVNILDRLAQRLVRQGNVKARELELDEALRLYRLVCGSRPAQDGLANLADLIARLSAREASHAYKAPDLTAAVHHAQRAVALKPDDSKSLMVLARAAHRTQDYRAALVAWQQLHGLEPGQVEPLLQMARYHQRFKEYDLAVNVCQRLLALDSSHQECQQLLQVLQDKLAAAGS